MTYSPDIALLFDLDGVLIDSEARYSELWKEINKKFYTGIDNLETVIKGTTLPDILSRYFPEPSIRSQVEIMCIEGEANMRYGLNPGVDSLLKELQRRNIPVAMVTSSDEVKMNHLWEILPELKQYFSTIIASEDVSRSKPDPEGYIKAAERLGIVAERCIVVEDSVQGIRAGKSAGAFVVGISTTLGRDAISKYADIIIDSMEEFELDKYIEIISQR